MKSLLHKTLSQFLVCTVAIFILATPLFFLLTKYFYAEAVSYTHLTLPTILRV